MSRIIASFSIDTSAWADFQALCAETTETPDTVLRDLVRLEVQRRTRRKSRRSEAPDEALLGRLRLLVAEALTEADNWHAYRCALRNRGLDIVPKGGGLVLVDVTTGRALAKASAVGPGYLPLTRRFGEQMPGHAARVRFPLRPGAIP